MIVCHCNRLTANDIGNAVECLKSNCANPDLCPDNVYGELGACPRCCNCFPLAEATIREAELRFIAKSQLTSPIPLSAENRIS